MYKHFIFEFYIRDEIRKTGEIEKKKKSLFERLQNLKHLKHI